MIGSKTISVSCASDHNYLCGLWVTLHSLCNHCSSGYALSIHILDCGLTSEDKSYLRVLESTFTHCSVTLAFHVVNLEPFKDLPSWRGNHATYARLLLQDILADEDYTIYTDVDMLWERDIAELWEMQTDDKVLWAATDGSSVKLLSSGKKRSIVAQQEGFDFAETSYFCAGLLMMNLKRLREMNFTMRAKQFLKERQAMIAFCDQDCYNFLIPQEDVQRLDFRWGVFAIVYGRRGEINTPTVIHYAKSAPWIFKDCVATDRWWRYLRDRAGCDVFGQEARSWRRKACRHISFYWLRSTLIVRILYRLMNARSATKYERLLVPEKYPFSTDELYE